MAFGSSMCLFSEVHGVILKSGQPVANARVERRYTWAWKNDRKFQDHTTTDTQGRFHFPAAMETSFWGGVLSHQPQILQIINIHYDDKIYRAWNLEKRNYEVNGEVNGQALKLLCDLDSEPSTKEGGYYGVCKIVADL